MSNTIIPAGYRITVQSWENDADCYAKNIEEGLTAEQTKLYVDALKLLESAPYDNPKGHGNLYEPNEAQLMALAVSVKGVLDRHGIVLEDLTGDMEEDADVYNDYFVCELVGDLTSGGDNFYTRIVSSIKVEYVPQPIELLDVTAEFN